MPVRRGDVGRVAGLPVAVALVAGVAVALVAGLQVAPTAAGVAGPVGGQPAAPTAAGVAHPVGAQPAAPPSDAGVRTGTDRGFGGNGVHWADGESVDGADGESVTDGVHGADGGVGGRSGDHDRNEGTLRAVQSGLDVDATVTRVRVAANGSARFTVEVRMRLATDGDVERFRTFQAAFRNGTAAPLDPFRERMRGVVAAAENATGREMAATDFAATTGVQELPRRWGVVTFRFRWVGMAARDGDALVVGDVFEGGYYIADGDTFEVTAPPDHRVARVVPEPDDAGDGTVSWTGPRGFADGRPLVRFEPAPADGGGNRLPVALPAVAVAVVAAGAVAGAYLRRRTAAGPVATDAERVADLLRANDGRMRQAEVGERLGWSASKTSRVVSSMAEEGTVEKVRLGRENLVELVEDGG